MRLEMGWDQITQALYTVLGGLGVALREFGSFMQSSGWLDLPFEWLFPATVWRIDSRGRSGIRDPVRRLLPGPQWEVMAVCVWERGKIPVCSEGRAHRLCREAEGRVRKKEESGKPRFCPVWRQGQLWGEPSWELFLEWGLLSTSSRSFFLMPVLAYRFLFFFWLFNTACRILVPWLGIEPVHPAVKRGVLTTELSWNSYFLKKF